ncbi:unnamed protein product [Dibothriocephalus latus]|uniref:RRM domain-containing protein n=1 Tax=Dibothriocephalus latus TaxID=60516 RepID=A0A3P6PIQ6_DIBLA|nr:unnamed protein product [Dibothriocephalus latus]
MYECDLHAQFSKFGLITEVFGPKNKMDSASVRRGFVTFLETDSVRRVLEAQPHLSLHPRILVPDRVEDDLTQSDDENDATLASYDPTIFIGHLKHEVTTSHLEDNFFHFGRVSKATGVGNPWLASQVWLF